MSLCFMFMFMFNLQPRKLVSFCVFSSCFNLSFTVRLLHTPSNDNATICDEVGFLY